MNENYCLGYRRASRRLYIACGDNYEAYGWRECCESAVYHFLSLNSTNELHVHLSTGLVTDINYLNIN